MLPADDGPVLLKDGRQNSPRKSPRSDSALPCTPAALRVTALSHAATNLLRPALLHLPCAARGHPAPCAHKHTTPNHRWRVSVEEPRETRPAAILAGRLYVGSAAQAHNWDLLTELKVTHIVNACR